MGESRENPNRILKRLQEERQAETRGHLKIFFGYAAGVGKTYAMLEAAHAAQRRGIDVAVGYVEPHQRPQTSELLNGLECLPVLSVNYRGVRLKEFDLNAALERNPKLIVVDELAHTNAEGCRHAKRYQDIEELLRAGIDVYTTVNVQHIESLNDMVTAITGITVHERIPDHVFDGASQVELVDIEPEELIERLNDGKIYREIQAQRALQNFFDIKNLTALREIALRRCADRINKISEKVRLAGKNDYYTDEHILVCLSSSPTNAKIIRTAARMADAFKGGFTALFVETPGFASMSEANKNRLRSNIHLAQQLGAAIETVYGDDVPFQISEFARLSGVSKIVIGRNNERKKYFWSKGTLSERLTENAPNIDIYIIPDKKRMDYTARKAGGPKIKFELADVVKSILFLCIATALGFVFYKLSFSEANIITVYILSVLLTAVVTSRRIYSLISSIVSVLTFNYFFTEPRFTLNAYDAGYPATFIIMFIAAFLTGTLAVKIKQHARQSAKTAYRTKILFETNQVLQKATSKNEIVTALANQLIKLLKKDIIFYRMEDGTLQEPSVFPAGEYEVTQQYTSETERAVAVWVSKNNKYAGATTSTLGSAKCLYLAVRVNDAVYGVVGIAVENTALDSFENSILLSMLGEFALALENEKVIREREEAAVLAKNEQVRANLLRAISHDLRTPLTSISGNANILLSSGDVMNSEKKRKLYSDIYDDSLWLINLVENILSVTRIEDGTMHLNLSTELMDEVVTEALRHINRKSVEHKIKVTFDEEFILARMDARLIVQVFINMIDNAVKYTPVGSEIGIRIRKEKGMVVTDISDNGPGIPKEEKSKIFNMFYTVNIKIADSRRSMGLGLALCKSIITAHGGEINVYDNTPHGTVFRFTLPAAEVNLGE